MATAALALFTFDASGSADGYRLLDPAEPTLPVTELATTRGDGIFEGVGLASGRPLKLARHLARLAESARRLDLPEQNPAIWSAAVHEVAAALEPSGLDGSGEGWIKLVLSRGDEVRKPGSAGIPTGWAYGTVAPSLARERAEGLRIVLLDRGYRHDVAETSPWLLQGAKTLSYAVNKSAVREAVRRDADDAVFVSSDGPGTQKYLLEGTTSSLVLRFGDDAAHPAYRPRHPGRYHPGRAVRVGVVGRVHDRPTTCSPRPTSPLPTPRGWSRRCDSRRRFGRSTASRRQWMPTSRPPRTPTCAWREQRSLNSQLSSET